MPYSFELYMSHMWLPVPFIIIVNPSVRQQCHKCRAEHGCTCRLPGSLPTGILLKKIIPGPVKILSHSSPGPTGNLPAGHRSTGNLDLQVRVFAGIPMGKPTGNPQGFGPTLSPKQILTKHFSQLTTIDEHAYLVDRYKQRQRRRDQQQWEVQWLYVKKPYFPVSLSSASSLLSKSSHSDNNTRTISRYSIEGEIHQSLWGSRTQFNPIIVEEDWFRESTG